jgi:hypothetical protein
MRDSEVMNENIYCIPQLEAMIKGKINRSLQLVNKIRSKFKEVDKDRYCKISNSEKCSPGTSPWIRRRKQWKFRTQKIIPDKNTKIDSKMVYFNEEAMSGRGYIKFDQDIEYVKRKNVKETAIYYWKRRKVDYSYGVLEVVGMKCYTNRRAPVLSINNKKRIKNTEISPVYVQAEIDPMKITKIKFGKQFEATPIYHHEKSVLFFTRLIQRRKKSCII